jgi:hypothetical protein
MVVVDVVVFVADWPRRAREARGGRRGGLSVPKSPQGTGITPATATATTTSTATTFCGYRGPREPGTLGFHQ